MRRLAMGIGTRHRGFRGRAWGLVAMAGLWSLSCGSPGTPSSGDGSPDVGSAGEPSVCPPDPLDAELCGGTQGPLLPVEPGAPCVLAIPAPPVDSNNVVVYLNKILVPEDLADGWAYGPTTATLVLTGTYCDLLTANPSESKVELVVGCSWLHPPRCIP